MDIQTNRPLMLVVIVTATLMVLAILVWIFMFLRENNAGSAAAPPSAETSVSSQYAGKKVLYVDSYHQGYEWSDGITSGIKGVLDETGVTLRIHRMDTKRNTSEEFKDEAAQKVHELIDTYQPDVLLVSDDNAFKYLVQPYYKDASLPVVFSGLNWDASVYDAPYSNTTGMVEISLTVELIEILREYARGDRVGYLTADVLTERKNAEYYERLFDLSFDQKYFVTTMDEWEQAFLKLQNEVDIVVFENNAGITDWDEARAEAFVMEHVAIPVGTTNPWTMQSSLIGLTKLSEEQGEWSALTALQILDGAAPHEIPVVTNKRGGLYVNIGIADKLGVNIRPDLLKNAVIIK